MFVCNDALSACMHMCMWIRIVWHVHLSTLFLFPCSEPAVKRGVNPMGPQRPLPRPLTHTRLLAEVLKSEMYSICSPLGLAFDHCTTALSEACKAQLKPLLAVESCQRVELAAIRQHPGAWFTTLHMHNACLHKQVAKKRTH